MGDEKSAADKTTGVVRWVVIGVLGLAFMLLFRAPITEFLGRASSVKISKEGVEIKSADTPLGKTQVSMVEGPAPQQNGIQGTTYVSQQYKFKISWPDNVHWSASETWGEQLRQRLAMPPTVHMPIAIVQAGATGSFAPNVNVVVEEVGFLTIQQYTESARTGLLQQGWAVRSMNFDPATQSALLVLQRDFGTGDVYQFQRIAVRDGRAYVVTASNLPPSNALTPTLRSDLNGILNSFELLR